MVLMPITSPLILKRGPPELPGLMEASVWINLANGALASPITRPFAEITPTVTVFSNPKGLPTAIAQSPCSDLSESPSTANGSESLFLILITARSVRSSLPTTLALNFLPSTSLTTISSASPTTWLLVRISPSLLIMTPEPRLCLCSSCGTSSSKKRRNSSNGSICPNGDLGKRIVSLLTVRVVEMLTTAPFACLASGAKVGKWGSNHAAAAGDDRQKTEDRR